MRVLLTGGSGFLGGHVAEALAARGDSVRALVRKTSNTKLLRGLKGVELFEGGVEQADRVREAMVDVDAVVHCAGIVKARSDDEFFAVNVGGTSNLVDAARGRRLRRFVHVSSLEASGPSDDGQPVPVDQENPVTAYGRSKLAAEKVVLGARDAFPVTVLRPAAIYGPRDTEILEMFKSIKRGLLPLVGGGTARGPWIYATDCAAACVRAIDAKVPSGSVYFVDDGTGARALRDVLADAERAMGKKALIRANLPAPVLHAVARGVEIFGRASGKAVMLTREKADMLLMDWICDSGKTQSELGWQPQVPWSEGVGKAVGWYRDNGWL
jgi:nucleoside-diphosphate-sugar epimerase